jgi:GNAT superfamily N-acetyltransferase
LIRYRAFENRDPPALAEIWRTQRPIRGRMQAVTPQLLEEHVFAKPWFDRHGLIVACDGDRPVGFVHAGFGPNADHRDLDYSQGTTCLLLVAPHPDRKTIALELLARSESYLRSRGARQIYAGSYDPLNAFYLGMYGSSDVAGVLASNRGWVDLLTVCGYRPLFSRVLAGRTLANFRPPIDRQQMLVRRRFRVQGPIDVLPGNWWDACVWSLHDWVRYDLALPGGGEPLVSAIFWDVEPLGRNWGVQTVGLVKLEDTPEARAEGLTTFLLAEALRQFQSQGYGQFEAQAAVEDESLRAVFAALGLEEYDRGSLWIHDRRT